MLFRLHKDITVFPHPALAEPDGLLAIGGDLSAERLELAYASGIFPWYSENEPILWYAPPERCVIFPEKIRISKSMRSLLKKEVYQVTVNKAFGAVIQNCATVPRKGNPGTWIHADMQKAYIALHESGWAASIEVWKDGMLVGGLYGVQMNRIFCGESMFSKMPNASKVALIALCHMDYRMIDCQIPNPHLMSMGAEMISREAYIMYLKNA